MGKMICRFCLNSILPISICPKVFSIFINITNKYSDSVLLILISFVSLELLVSYLPSFPYHDKAVAIHDIVAIL